MTEFQKKIEAEVTANVREYAKFLGVPVRMVAQVFLADRLGLGARGLVVRGAPVPAGLDADGREVET